MNRGLASLIRTMAVWARRRRSITVPMGSAGSEGMAHAPARAAHGTGLKESEFVRAIRGSVSVVVARAIAPLSACPLNSGATAPPDDPTVAPLSHFVARAATRARDAKSSRATRRGGATTWNVGRRLAA